MANPYQPPLVTDADSKASVTVEVSKPSNRVATISILFAGVSTSAIFLWAVASDAGMYGGEKVYPTIFGHAFLAMFGAIIGGTVGLAISLTWQTFAKNTNSPRNKITWCLALLCSVILSPLFTSICFSILTIFSPVDLFSIIFDLKN